MKNRKTIASILAFLLAAIMLLSLIAGILPRPVEAASSSEIKKQLDALKEERDELDEQLSNLKSQYNSNLSEIKDIVAQKQLLDQEIFLLHEQVNKTNDMIATYNVLIADLQEDLNEAEDRLQTLNEQYKERIRTMEEDGELSYWSVLFKANSFSDLLDRLSMVQEIAAADRRRLDELNQAAVEVTEVKTVLEEEKQGLEETKKSLDETQAELEVKRQEADALLAELIAQGMEYELLVAQSEEAQAQLMLDIANKEYQYDNAIYQEWLATSVPPATKPLPPSQTEPPETTEPTEPGETTEPTEPEEEPDEGWIVPINYTAFTSPFGEREAPTAGASTYHYGVDLAAPTGTPIYASRSGTVTTASYGSSSGYYVQIDHGDGYRSIYMHMTHYDVYAGQYVRQGQVIGYCGSTGVSTGPHLHFGISLNGSYVNPANYIPI